MSDSTAAAVIGACALLGAAVLALIGVLLPVLLSIRRKASAAEQHAAVAADGITNDHDKNLREELDERHAENAAAIAAATIQVAHVAAAVRSADKRNGRRWADIRRELRELREHVVEIDERTSPPPIRRRTR